MSAVATIPMQSQDTRAGVAAIRFEAGSVTGLLERPGQIAGLTAALKGAGFGPGSIEIVRNAHASDEKSSLLDRMREWLVCLGPERQLAGDYRAELIAGAVLVTVRNVPADQRDRIAAMLIASGGYFVHGFDRFTVRRLAR